MILKPFETKILEILLFVRPGAKNWAYNFDIKEPPEGFSNLDKFKIEKFFVS